MRGLALLLVLVAVVDCGSSSTPPPAPPPPPPCGDACTPPTWTTLDLVAGLPGGRGWVDGPLATAHFEDPWALTGDGKGHLYLADGDVLRAIDLAAGTVSTVAGKFGVLGGADGVGPAATFNTPAGVAFGGGVLYVTDTENHTVRTIDVASGTTATVAGLYGKPGTTDGIGSAARFVEPEGLALDTAGKLYIGDTDNNMIRVMDVATQSVTTLAGAPSTSGTTDGVGAAARFDKPKAVTLDGAGNLYVAEATNQTIRKIVVATQTVTTLAKFDAVPQGLCLDGADVIASMSDDTIVRVDPTGQVKLIAGAQNAAGFIDAVGQDARLDSPAGLLNDGAGTIYVVDNLNAVVRTFTLATGAIATFAGARSVGSDDGTGAKARFSTPQALAADAQFAYVADTGNSTIRKVVLATGEVTTLAGVAGQPGDANGAGKDARFFQPAGAALDGAAQKLYVVDGPNHAVKIVDVATGAVEALTYSYAPNEGTFDTPVSAALDHGRLFVTDYGKHTVRVIDLGKKVISTLAGKAGVSGTKDGTGTDANFYGPSGIASDGNGHLFVADSLNHEVRAIDAATGAVTSLAGEPGIQGAVDGVGRAARFRYPTSVTADSFGRVFVADANNAVRRVDVATGTVTSVIGALDGGGVRLGPLPAQVEKPSALAVTPAGGLLVFSQNALLLAH